MQDQKPSECDCRNTAHISHTSKTEGTPYLKGFCSKCKSWVYTDKKYCLCCRRYVKHAVHHLRLKRIYNQAVRENQDNIVKFREGGIPEDMFLQVNFHGALYHIPISMIVRYSENDYTKDTLYQFQDSITRVRKPKPQQSPEQQA